MIKFLSSTTKSLTFVWGVLIASSITNAEENSVDLDTLYTIFETIAKPILQSAQLKIPEDDVNNELDSVLEQQIKDRFSQSFVPNKHMSNDIPVAENSEETVILEIPSSSEIQPSRRKDDSDDIVTDEPSAKYKQLQDKIGSLLSKEKISDKTKDLLSNAFEKVINQINRPCLSNKRSKDLTPKMNRRLLGKLEKAARKTMLKSWKHRFNKLIDTSETFDSKENSKFLAKLRDFFFEMHNDFQNLTRRYDFNCDVVNIKKIGRSEKKVTVAKHGTNPTPDKKKIRVDNNALREKKACTFFKICPYELKMFVTDFYAFLLDKVNLVFHNYRKMYLVDTSKENSSEKKSFMKFMDEVKNQVKKKYNVTIAKEKSKIVLDSNSDIYDKVTNIKKNIDKSVANVKALIENALADKGGELASRMKSAVKKDIMTNADIELSQVQEKFKSKMCKSFETCYGKDRKTA